MDLLAVQGTLKSLLKDDLAAPEEVSARHWGPKEQCLDPTWAAVRALAGRSGSCAGLRGDGGGGEGAHSRAGMRSWGGREAEWVQRGAPGESRPRPGRGSPRGVGVREDCPRRGLSAQGCCSHGSATIRASVNSVQQRLGRRVGELPVGRGQEGWRPRGRCRGQQKWGSREPGRAHSGSSSWP